MTLLVSTVLEEGTIKFFPHGFSRTSQFNIVNLVYFLLNLELKLTFLRPSERRTALTQRWETQTSCNSQGDSEELWFCTQMHQKVIRKRNRDEKIEWVWVYFSSLRSKDVWTRPIRFSRKEQGSAAIMLQDPEYNK